MRLRKHAWAAASEPYFAGNRVVDERRGRIVRKVAGNKRRQVVLVESDAEAGKSGEASTHADVGLRVTAIGICVFHVLGARMREARTAPKLVWK